MALWRRQVFVQVGSPSETGKSFAGLRVSFDVKMSRASSPNSATLEIYNVNPASVALAQDSAAEVRLLVGYDVPRLIFVGNPVKNGVRLDRRGPDRVLHIEAQDGGRSYADSRVSVSFTTQTTARQVFDAVAAQMGLPQGTIRVDETLVFPKGIVLAGPARDVLDRLADSLGSDWFIRDGALQFVGTGEDTGEAAVVFSAGAGNLIGSPSPKDGGIQVRALLEPGIRPGKVFKVESEDYTGFYTAGDVQFQGDSGWDTPYYVVVQGKPRS